MMIVHPIDAPLFDAMFNRDMPFSIMHKKRVELHRRHLNGEALDVLVNEAKKFASAFGDKITATK